MLRLDGSKQIGEVGRGGKSRLGPSSLSLPELRRQSRPGAPGTAALLSHSPGVANGCRGPGCRGPGRSREGPARPQPLASAHVTSASTAEMELRPGDRGRMGGREAPRHPTPACRRRRRLARLPTPVPPQPTVGLTCVADDDVLEEIGVRHGRGRSVPGSRSSSRCAPPPRPHRRRSAANPGPARRRPPSEPAARTEGEAGRTDSAERGSQRPSPSEQ